MVRVARRVTCRFCGNDCEVEVDHRFPAAAVLKYGEAGRTTAPRCAIGQDRDMEVVGWCVDRAVRHEGWTGEIPTGLTWGKDSEPGRDRR